MSLYSVVKESQSRLNVIVEFDSILRKVLFYVYTKCQIREFHTRFKF